MNYPTHVRPWTWSIVWLGTAALSVVVFVGMVIVTEGILLPMLITAAAMAAVGLVHYLVWGREFVKDVAPARALADTLARTEWEKAQPRPPVVLELGERQRSEMVRVLEEWLATTGTAAQSTPQNRETNQAVRELLDKLRSFGA